MVKWQHWPYLLDVLKIIDEHKDTILFKARQLGWSWLMGGWALHKVLFSEAAKGLMLSQNEKYAFSLLSKPKTILRNLPPFLKRTENHVDNQGILDFKTSSSILEALPSTENAGRSADASFAVRDELANHPYGEINFASIGPTIDAGKAKLIDISTINKEDLENHFTERVERALRGATRYDLPSGLALFTGGESGAALIFGGWRLRPQRSEDESLDEWFASISKKYPPWLLEQEYPETIEEALRFSEARAYFDVNALEQMGLNTMIPIKQDTVDTYNGLIRVYKLPQVGRKYCVFTDPSAGVDDPFATVVMDTRNNEGIITASGKVPVERVAEVHDYLVRVCFKAINSFDITGQVGGEFAKTVRDLGTPNVAPRRDTIMSGGRVKKERVGMYLSSQHKKEMLEGLARAIRSRDIINYEKDAVHQFQAFILPEGEKEPRITKGVHDDFIIAWAGALKLSEEVPKGEMRVTTGKYRD